MNSYSTIRPIPLTELGHVTDLSVPDPNQRLLWVVNTPKQPFTRIPGHSMDAYVYFDPDENQWYLIKTALAGASPKFAQAKLFHCVYPDGSDFILPITQPLPGQSPHWCQSMTDIIRQAKTHWVNVRKNTLEKCYDLAHKKLCQHVPYTADYTMEESLGVAFPGKYYVDRADHPLIKKLQRKYAPIEVIEDDEAFFE